MSKRVNFADLYDLNLSRPVSAQATVTAPSTDTELITETAQPADTAETTVTVEPPPPSPQIAVTAESTVSALVTHPEQYYSAPNELDDRVMPTLRPSEQVVLRRIYRLTRGFHKATCNVSVGKIARACNISEKKAGTALNLLEDRGFIKRIDSSNKGKTNELRGLTIECLIPEAVTARSTVSAKSTDTAPRSVTASSSDNKVNALKGNNKRGDELALDTRNCPDCQGTGYCYPEGPAKGVKRCEHKRL
jgi:hypothetical protein